MSKNLRQANNPKLKKSRPSTSFGWLHGSRAVNLGAVVQNIKGYTNCLSVGPGGQVCQPNKKPLHAACTDKI